MADLAYALTASINGLAAYGELAYTERQLYYDVCCTLVLSRLGQTQI